MAKPPAKTNSRAARFLRVVSPCLVALFIVFIFYNSSKPGPVSSAASEQVTAFLSGTQDVPENSLLETIVRKAGHVGEYALLGLLVFVMFRLYAHPARRAAALTLGFCLVVGIADECYQLSIPGRAGLISDVAIDTAGAVLGILLGCCVLWAARAVRQRRHAVQKAAGQHASSKEKS